MRVYEDYTPQLIDTFNYIFQAQTNALASGDYPAFYNLVDQLEILLSGALTKEERENIRRVKRLQREYIRHLNNLYNEEEDFKEDEEEKSKANEYLFLIEHVRLTFKKIINKILSNALSYTILEKIVQKDASPYDFEEDLKAELEELEFTLESYGIEPLRAEAVSHA